MVHGWARPSRPESSSCSSARGTPGDPPAECPRVLRVEVSVVDRRPAAALPAAQPHIATRTGWNICSIPQMPAPRGDPPRVRGTPEAGRCRGSVPMGDQNNARSRSTPGSERDRKNDLPRCGAGQARPAPRVKQRTVRTDSALGQVRISGTLARPRRGSRALVPGRLGFDRLAGQACRTVEQSPGLRVPPADSERRARCPATCTPCGSGSRSRRPRGLECRR